ncbi:MAG: hypothetical protein ACRDD1_06715, partial [Planctomycetia bacterium]
MSEATITQSLTLRGAFALAVAFAVAKFAPDLPAEQAREIAEAIATLAALVGAIAVGVGRGRHGFAAPAPDPMIDATHGLVGHNFLGKSFWRGARSATQGAARDVLLQLAIEAASRALSERERTQRFADLPPTDA